MALIDDRVSTLTTILKQNNRNLSESLRVMVPGKVTSFDPSTGLAEIQPTISTQLVDGQVLNVPLLIDVPIMVLKTLAFEITLPVKAGDECIVFFCDQAIDNWIQFGKVQAPSEIRSHELSDAFFLPVSTSQPDFDSSYSPNNLEIKSDNNTFIMKPDGTVEVSASQLNLNANVKIDGDLEVTGTSTASDHLSRRDLDLISGANHTHTSTTSGNPTSPPLPPSP